MPPRRRWTGARQIRPPDGRIRQSQVVTTFGPGSMLDLLDDAVLVGGLDFWRFGDVIELVNEPRLLEAVEPLYLKKGWALSKQAPFRKPPVGDEQQATDSSGIQVLEFPRWFICQKPACRALVRASSLERTNNQYRHHCSGNGKPERCVPIRFVSACPRGHLTDIDWPWWSHEHKVCEGPQLRIDEGVTGDFSEIEIVCNTCGKKRRLIQMMVPEAQDRCLGDRPWLGADSREPCTEKQRLLTRTASNGYFAQTTSVLTIPEEESLRRRVQSAWNVLQAATVETIGAFRTIPEVKQALGNATDDEVLAAIIAEREPRPEAVPQIRTAEWQKFLGVAVEKPGEMPTDRTEPFWARRMAIRPGALPAAIKHVVLARRLREVQAQVGFTRLEPLSKDLQGRYDLEVELAPLSLQQAWLPVTENRGEGVLLVLDEAKVHAWEISDPVKRRTESLFKGWEKWKASSKSTLPFPGVRLYLLHSLSHLLMTELALECGYPASSIRERIYCEGHGAAVPMAGVLLMTGTPGAEGTLGGLVEEGKELGRHLKRVWRDAQLCSNDPVCAHHDPAGHGDRPLEGAACHGCLFVPECSCERFNQYLDRALVVPTLGHEDVAFFGSAWT